MNKEAQFEQFLDRLRNGEVITYTFFIDFDWLERHGSYENYSVDWIDVITERFTDDGSSVIQFRWSIEPEHVILVLERSDDDSPWYHQISFSVVDELDDIKELFEVSQ